MNNIFIAFLVSAPAALIATTIHEFTRATVSSYFGDVLPREKKRLTLNPFKHFEPIGFILMVFFNGFGWGKPVETSGLYYKNRKRDTLITAVAPSIANLVFALIIGYFYKVSVLANFNTYVVAILNNLFYFNVSLAVYNILPITPMDGLKVMSQLMPANSYFKYIQYEKIIQMVVLLLLFLGYVGMIFTPIVNFVLFILNLLIFI